MVVLTVCINDVFVDIIKRVHLIMEAVSLWTRPPAPAPVCRALKTHPIQAHQRGDELPQTTKPQRVQPWELDCLLHESTCGFLSTCTTGTTITLSRQTVETHDPTNSLDHGKQHLHLDRENLHDHAQQGRRTPCQQLGNIYGLTKSLDHEKPHARHDRDVNDQHDLTIGTSTTQHKLQLRNLFGPTLDHEDRPPHNDGNVSVLRKHSDFLNEQELWEDDCPTHNLHVRTQTTSTKGTSAVVSTSNCGISWFSEQAGPQGTASAPRQEKIDDQR